ncbi:MAG TPA: hypothetical protein VGC09_11430 [Rhodopila sp.]
MNTNYRGVGGAVGLLTALLATSCTSASSDLDIQSKFAYPNGDYTMLGTVSAQKTYTTTSFSGPVMTREVFLDLQQAALAKQPGADFVVNYVVSSTVTQVPPIPVAWTTFRLEGTALKVVEVGGQKYSDSNVLSPTRTK